MSGPRIAGLVGIMERLGFDVVACQRTDEVTVTRRRDGMQMRMSHVFANAAPMSGVVDLILKTFRDYDASTATPDHWMAL